MTIATTRQEELIRRTMQLAAQTATEGNLPFAALLIDESGAIIIEATMIPNITMDDVVAHTPFSLSVTGNILATDCAEQIRLLAKR